MFQYVLADGLIASAFSGYFLRRVDYVMYVFAITFKTSLPGHNVPIRIRQAVVAVHSGQTSIASAVVEVPERLPR